jgi:hypothetical protein
MDSGNLAEISSKIQTCVGDFVVDWIDHSESQIVIVISVSKICNE